MPDIELLEQEHKRKRDKNSPCMFYEIPEGKDKPEERFPAVSCGNACWTCGWNPKVAQARIEIMKDETEQERAAAIRRMFIKLKRYMPEISIPEIYQNKEENKNG